MRLRPQILLCLALVACGSPSSQETADSGSAADAGLTADSGSTSDDAGGMDGGTQDGDAGPGDAGLDDAGVPDSGPTDAGPGDAGPIDGGPVDGGVQTGQGWTVSGDVVVDHATGLSWDSADGPGGATYGSGSGKYTWQEAKDYCAGKSARLATYADAPAVSESGTLADEAHADWTAFTTAFGGAWNSWSATTVDGVPTKAWHYYIDNTGSAVGYKGLKDDGYHARCVR